MKIFLKKFCQTAIVTICSIVLAAIIPAQMVAYADYKSIPSNLRGMYDTSVNSGYYMVISKDGTNVTFRGYLLDYGDVAAGYPGSIYYNPVSDAYKDNFVISFSKYSTYNSNTQEFKPVDGEAIFRANLNPYTAEMHVLVNNIHNEHGLGEYYYSKNYHVYYKV